MVETRKEQGQPPVRRSSKWTATSHVVLWQPNICPKQVIRLFAIFFFIYIYIFLYIFLFLLSIITLFALNSTGRHAYIACNGVEPQKTSLSTSVTFNKICEGKSPINCFVYPFVVCTWPVFYHTKSWLLYNTVHQTCQRLQDETARLAELKTELLCTDEVVAQWLSDVKEWAAGGKQDQIKKIKISTNITSIWNFKFDIKEQLKVIGWSSMDYRKLRHHQMFCHIYYVGYFSYPSASAHTKFSEVLKEISIKC